MPSHASRTAIDEAYRREGRRVLATLIRLLGGFDAAEEGLHEAFAAAAAQWPRDGIPANPYAWLVSTGRFRTINRWRHQARLTAALPQFAALGDATEEPAMPQDIHDDELRLIFTCCHPALVPDARVALTLREVGGLTTEEIARAYLVPAPTIAQRIVRAKAKIQREAIDYEVPGRAELPARTESVLRVIYLVFNEGYLATSGPDLSRPDLCLEAIRLGRLAADLLGTSEVLGLLALMLLHQTRFATRMDASGDLVLLEDQERSRWDHAQIAEAAALIGKAWASAGRPGPYVLQAALAAVHAQAPSFAETDWTRIVSLYDLLGSIDGSPVVRLNRAVAIGMRDGSSAGIMAIDAVMADGSLEGYHLAHAARADLQRRLGLADAARTSYERALQLASQPAERRFLQSRLDQLKA